MCAFSSLGAGASAVRLCSVLVVVNAGVGNVLPQCSIRY